MSEGCKCGQSQDLEDIKRLLRLHNDEGFPGYSWSFWERYSTDIDKEYFVSGLGTVEFLERSYADEGDIFMVWRVGEDYYKLSGWYSSYTDATWDTFKKVERKTRSAYVYE